MQSRGRGESQMRVKNAGNGNYLSEFKQRDSMKARIRMQISCVEFYY